ncbi:aldo/keto reductase [Pendulispora rubella]|uniref:Aldo/keto reductase n=1 Tax=Pendulispora rubella TaxID=2741070 RepID=A0ABZ2KR25_9BACT
MSQEKAPRTIQLGKTGPKVFSLGLGCMAFSGMYGATSEDEGIATIRAAIERGVTLLDTGDFYGMGHNEMLIRRALEGQGYQRDNLQISVKFGGLRAPDGAFLAVDMRPVAVKNFAAYSLKRLGVEVIDIYRPSRLDPNVPIEETVGAIADLIKQGYVRHVGLSEVGAETIRRAHAVHPVTDLQIEYSLASRGPEEKIFPVLRELGISATLYGILSRGLLSGRKPKDASDFRSHLPRFSGDDGAHNEQIVARLRAFAEASGRTPSQLAIAWVAAKQPAFVPLVGARTLAQLDDAFGVLDKPLSVEDVHALEAIVPVGSFRGDRYSAVQMAHLDSER